MNDKERKLRDDLAELERMQKGLADCPNRSNYPREWFMWHKIYEAKDLVKNALEGIQNER